MYLERKKRLLHTNIIIIIITVLIIYKAVDLMEFRKSSKIESLRWIDFHGVQLNNIMCVADQSLLVVTYYY